MKRLFTILGIVFVLSLLPNTGFAEREGLRTDRLHEAIEIAVSSIVPLYARSNKGGYYQFCSGVLIRNRINESIILTASHCIKKNRPIFIESHKVYIVGRLTDQDLAYIKLNTFISYNAVKLSDYMTHPENDIVAIGYIKDKLHAHKGYIFYKAPTYDIGIIDVRHGMSGGGVFNDHGELIGIITARIPYINLGYFNNLKGLHTFVAVNKLLE